LRGTIKMKKERVNTVKYGRPRERFGKMKEETAEKRLVHSHKEL